MRIKYYGRAESPAGDSIASATVKIYLAGTTAPASIYTSVSSVSPVSQVTTDEYGYYTFYVNAFDYDQSQLFDLVLNRLGYATTYTFYNIQSDNIIPGTYNITENTSVSGHVYIPKGVVLNISNGIVLTFSVMPEIGLYTVFTGTGTVAFPNGCRVYIDWWGDDLATVVANIDTADATVVISDTVAIAENISVPSNVCLMFDPPGKLDVEAGYTVTIGKLAYTNIYQIFDGAGTITIGAGAIKEAYPEWYGTANTAIKAIIASGAKNIMLTNTTYDSMCFSLSAYQCLMGLGKESTVINKVENGTLITMATGSELHALKIDGDGVNYTGKGVVIAAGYKQVIRSVTIDDTEDIGLDIQAAAVSGQVFDDIIVSPTVPATVTAIKTETGMTAKPRFFSNIWCPGGIIDVCNAVDQFFNNAYFSHLLSDFVVSTGLGSQMIYLNNVRFGHAGATTLNLAASQISGSIAGDVILGECQGLNMMVFDPSYNTITENANSNTNAIQTRITAYTPVWSQASGTPPALGNGTITGYYERSGLLCHVYISLVMGTTSTYGDGTAGWTFTIPFLSNPSLTQYGQIGRIFLGLTDYFANISLGGGYTIITLGINGGAVRAAVPGAWAAADRLDINFTYMVR